MNFIRSGQALQDVARDRFFVERDYPRFGQFKNDVVMLQYIRATMMVVHGRRRTTETFVVPLEWVMEGQSGIVQMLGEDVNFSSEEGLPTSRPFPDGLPGDTGIEQFSSRSTFSGACLMAKNGDDTKKKVTDVTQVGRIIYRNEVVGDSTYELMRSAVCSVVAVYYRSDVDLIICKVDVSVARKEIMHALSTCGDIEKTMWKASHWTHKEMPKEMCAMATITCQQGLFIAIGKIASLRKLEQAVFLKQCYIRDLGCWFPGVAPRHGVFQNMDGVMCNTGYYTAQVMQKWFQGDSEQKIYM